MPQGAGGERAIRATTRARARTAVCLVLSAWLLAAIPAAQRRAPKVEPVSIGSSGLALRPEGLEELVAVDGDHWRARLGSSVLSLAIDFPKPGPTPLLDVEDALEVARKQTLDPVAEPAPVFRRDPGRIVAGPFGYAPYAALVRQALSPDAAGTSGVRWLLVGLLPEGAWWLTVDARPEPVGEAARTLTSFLENALLWSGEVRDPRWSDEEALERWREYAPPSALEDYEGPQRTKHYLILTDSASGALFGRKMEECYERIRTVFPFEEVPGRRLLPVFLFRDSEDYYEFYARIAGFTLEQAQRSTGHSWRDYYATFYSAPGDPIHVHEATHQLFAQRLHRTGGGSWFQEGMAEYLSSKPGDRSFVAAAVRRGRFTPLRDFVRIPDLMQSPQAAEDVGTLYAQAALLTEFLRESKWSKERFPAYVDLVGRTSKDDPEEIEAAIRAALGVELGELEERFVAYCKRR